MRFYGVLIVALSITVGALLVTMRRPAECLSLDNIALVDPIVERLAIKQYPGDIVKQRLAIARWDSVRRETKRNLSHKED